MLNDSLEVVSVDQEGNTWMLKMYQMASKSNRYQLSFFFNEKEFELAKFQSLKSATDMWHLICLLRKNRIGIAELKKFISKDSLQNEQQVVN